MWPLRREALETIQNAMKLDSLRRAAPFRPGISIGSDMLNRKVNPLIGLAVMLIANLLLCYYPLYQLRNYPAADHKPDASVPAVIIAFSLTLAALLLVPIAMFKAWGYSRSFTYPKRVRTLVAALLMSVASLAPVCYWVALFIRVRNEGG